MLNSHCTLRTDSASAQRRPPISVASFLTRMQLLWLHDEKWWSDHARSNCASERHEGRKIAARRTRNGNDRAWTAVERHKLRGLADRGLPASTIARSLRRPLGFDKGDGRQPWLALGLRMSSWTLTSRLRQRRRHHLRLSELTTHLSH